MTADDLRRLLAEATPGPWTESGRDVDHDKLVAEGRNPGDACGLGCEIDGPEEAWLRGQFQRHADAALIVAARNVLPALLDVVEAARAVVDPFVTGGGGDRWWKAHDDLDAALARLESAS